MVIETKNRTIEYYLKDDCPFPFVYWRDVQEPGWVLTDDGYVVFAKKVNHIREVRGKNIRVRRRIKLPYGNRFAHGRDDYRWEDAYTKKYRALGEKDWVEHLVFAEPAIVGVLAKYVMVGKLHMDERRKYDRFEYSIFVAISKYFFNTEDQWWMIRTFFNHDKARAMIQKKIEQNLKDRDIDVEKVFDLLQKAEHMALTHVDKCGNVGNPTAVLAVADRYAGILNMSMNGKKGQGELPSPQAPPEELPGANHTYDKILNDGNVTDAVVITEGEK